LSFGVSDISWLIAVSFVLVSSCWVLFDLFMLRRAIRKL
jgi:hypothetical protein